MDTLLNIEFEEFVIVSDLRSTSCVCRLNLLLQLRIKAYLRQAAIFKELGNTASAYTCHLAVRDIGNHSALTPSVVELALHECRWEDYWVLRHPDPDTIFRGKQTVSVPELQVRGIWKKLKVGTGKGKPVSRSSMATCIWKGMQHGDASR